jgi:hypothetical protein
MLVPETMSPKFCGAQEFWTPQPVPRRVLDPSTCAPRSFGEMQPVPAKFWRHSFWAQEKHKNDLKITFSFFFKGNFL